MSTIRKAWGNPRPMCGGCLRRVFGIPKGRGGWWCTNCREWVVKPAKESKRVMRWYRVRRAGVWKRVRAGGAYTAMWKAFKPSRGYHWTDEIVRGSSFADVFTDRRKHVERFFQQDNG